MVFLLGVLAAAGEPPPSGPVGQALRMSDLNELAQLVRGVRDERRQTTDDLIAFLANRDNLLQREAAVTTAMEIAGCIRATECAEVLARHVAYPRVFPESSHYPRGNPIARAYPDNPLLWARAAAALISIGEPAVPFVTEELGNVQSDAEPFCALTVLVGILGADRARTAVDSVADRTESTETKRYMTNLKARIPQAVECVAQWEASKKPTE